MKKTKHLDKTLVRQHDTSDCGVACLLSVLKYHQGSQSLENLRRLSGTSKTGTTLLGLYQAAAQLGFDAQGAEGDLEALQEQPRPVILHVQTPEQQHYVVCNGRQADGWVIGIRPRAFEIFKAMHWTHSGSPKSVCCLSLTTALSNSLKTVKKKDIVFGHWSGKIANCCSSVFF